MEELLHKNMTEELDIVNKDDQIIGKSTRKDAHDKKLRHRSVMFFVFDQNGKLLMTKRSEDKRFYPGYWSIVLGGHVPAGFSYEEALEKEMEEEIGTTAPCENLGSFKKEIEEENENVRLYKAVVDPKKIELSPKEFEKGLFVTFEELESEKKKKNFLPETKMVLEFLNLNHRS